MKKTATRLIICTVVLACVVSSLCVIHASVSRRRADRLTERPERVECWVRDLQLIVEGGVYPKWSEARGLIVFNKLVRGEAFTKRIPGVFEIFTVRPDGSGMTCMTCGVSAIPSIYHKGQPFWHPSGEYIIFSAQNEHTKATQHNLDSLPGIGHNHDVWIMSSDGERFWQITDYEDDRGVIRPSFSHDGEMIHWNEEYSIEAHPGVGSEWSMEENRRGEEWGLWRIKIADVDLSSGEPVVSNVRTVSINDLYPGKRLIEGSGFTPDDGHLIFEAADIPETNGSMWWGDVYVSDLSGGSLERLTTSAKRFQGNENMEYSPDGRLIAWSHHDSDVPGREVEIYLMSASGADQTRLTYFNLTGHAHSRSFQWFGRTNGCGELDWDPDGKRIVFSMSNGGQLFWPHFSFNLYMLTFQAPCGRALVHGSDDLRPGRR